MTSSEVDFIIVGGGLAGCTVASRLHQNNTSLKILVLEAGIDPKDNPNILTPMGGFALLGSDLDWTYPTAPQPATGDRVHIINSGKGLGGSSLINYGGWIRGDATDYDSWANVVGDARWSYKGLLPYMRKSEGFTDSTADPEQHGLHGPMHVTSVSASDPERRYPLREPIRNAWTELGVKVNPDPSSGSLVGISEFLENWYNGQRQFTQAVYKLDDVQVTTNATVQRVLFSKNNAGYQVATAVELVDGRQFSARKEIIISAGALRTPQILMLSGIGPRDTLSKFNIPLVHEVSEVGKNLFDHFALYQLWKLRDAERGLALGSPLLTNPALFKGFPSDWAINEAVPIDLLKQALQEDETAGKVVASTRSLLEPGRCHVETVAVYSTLGTPGIPLDGSYITTSVMLFLPTSRGCISIASNSATDKPVIDSNYYTTSVDRTALIYGTRRVLQAFLETSAGKSFIETEVAPPGFSNLTTNSTDGEIDARIRATGMAHHHSAGSAAMGQVVGTDLCVYSVHGLRVVDASVLPVAIGGHPQATLYALAEQAVDLILNDL